MNSTPLYLTNREKVEIIRSIKAGLGIFSHKAMKYNFLLRNRKKNCVATTPVKGKPVIYEPEIYDRKYLLHLYD